MIARLNAHEIYQSGLESIDSLSQEERVVFLLIELETCSAMEGWDHFFTSDRMQYYKELKVGLTSAGARESLEVLSEYEAFFRERGVEFEPAEIEDFLIEFEEEALDRDWGSEYDDLSETRWNQIRQWLRTKGIALEE